MQIACTQVHPVSTCVSLLHEDDDFASNMMTLMLVGHFAKDCVSFDDVRMVDFGNDCVRSEATITH